MSTINWGALGLVAVVSLAAGVVIVVLVSLALVGLSARQAVHVEGAAVSSDGTEPVGQATVSNMSAGTGTALAVVCLAAAAAIVLFGLYTIVF